MDWGQIILCQVVYLSKTHSTPIVLIIMCWLHPNMTVKLLTGTIRIQTDNSLSKEIFRKIGSSLLVYLLCGSNSIFCVKVDMVFNI